MGSEIVEVSSELENKFDRASKHFTSLVSLFSTEELLYFYARFKQATEGECNIPKPSFLNPSGRRKWEAWKSLSAMTKKAAMLEYIKAVEEGDPTWCSDGSGSSSATSSWARVSRMPVPEVLTFNRSDDSDYCNTFLEGVQEGRVEEVSCLPTLDQLVTRRFEEGMTGLHWAADRGHGVLVELLLQRGAAIDAQDEGGQTALHFAASCGHKVVVAALLKHGADATLKDEDGLTAQQVVENAELLEMF